MSSEPSQRDEGTLKVRLLQTNPRLGDVDGNLRDLADAVRGARTQDLVVAPELATHGYHLGEVPGTPALDAHDPRLLALGQGGPAVAVGFAEAHRHHTFNSAALVSDGRTHVQRKLFLPTYRGWEERKHFRPGAALRCHDLPKARVATLICNDAWQPVLPWLAAHDGAEVLLVPTNSATSEVGLPTSKAWEIILQHAAVALQCYVVFVNRSGEESGRTFWGGSRVIHPSGDVMGELGDGPGELDCELDLEELRALRRQWPLLQETRADLVAREALRLVEEGL